MNIDKEEMAINELVREYQEKMKFQNDLQKYVKDNKATVRKLIKCLK